MCRKRQFFLPTVTAWRTIGRLGTLLLAVTALLWGSLSLSVLAEGERSIQPYLDRVRDAVTEFTLDNGMRFVLLERHEAPIVSFVTYANVGGVNEPEGLTGVAHFLEHLAFKGTPRIGTTDYPAEAKVLAKLDRANQQLKNAREAEGTANAEEIRRLQAEFDRLLAEAQKYVKRNEFSRIVDRYGGVGLNATTSADATKYFYSLPANKLELWMSLESERFLEPVFREFYREKEVILEERRLRTDNSAIGTFVEKFRDAAFAVHPYQQPTIGYVEDLLNMEREEVENFFATYYVPNNLTVGIVGDIDPKEVRRLAEIYFGRYERGPEPPEVEGIEPPQTEQREVTVRFPSEPAYLEGYHRPAISHPDNAIYEAIVAILGDGRTSRLNESLVEDRQIALAAEGYSSFPDDKYPTLVLFYVLTAPGHTVEEAATALQAEIERLKTEPVSPQELQRVKAQSRAGLLRALDSNKGMAKLLLEYEVKTGDWRNLFAEIDAIAAVTPEDILRVARATFRPENRTIGKLLPPEE